MNRFATCASLLVIAAAGGCASSSAKTEPTSAAPAPTPASPPASTAAPAPSQPTLGNFSVSLAVKDLAASKAFYEKLGFKQVFGKGKAFAIMQNDTATIGLFQGMFEKNILTFNPGWDRSMGTLASFDDVREIQRVLASRGLSVPAPTPASPDGPASVVLFDPDGNQIVIDQHVARPAAGR